MRGPVQSHERPQQPRGRDRVCGVIEEANREEPEHERSRLAPEPEILMQRVEQSRREEGQHHAIYYAIMRVSESSAERGAETSRDMCGEVFAFEQRARVDENANHRVTETPS